MASGLDRIGQLDPAGVEDQIRLSLTQRRGDFVESVSRLEPAGDLLSDPVELRVGRLDVDREFRDGHILVRCQSNLGSEETPLALGIGPTEYELGLSGNVDV